MNVMQSVIKLINLTRGEHRAERHRRFVGFLRELDAEFSDFPLDGSIRWLSTGKILKHFFGLRKEILSFFEEQLMDGIGNFQAQLQSTKFLCELVFLIDIKYHLNMVNLSL